MTMHPMQECVQRLCNKIDKIKLFANLGARLFQETDGLSRWQELINNEKKNNKSPQFLLSHAYLQLFPNAIERGCEIILCPN